jgi:hypothetical protein
MFASHHKYVWLFYFAQTPAVQSTQGTLG